MTTTIHRIGGNVLPVLHGECACGQEVSCTAYSDCVVYRNEDLPPTERVYMLRCTNCESNICMVHMKNKQEYISRLEILQMLDEVSESLKLVATRPGGSFNDYRVRSNLVKQARDMCDKLLRG
jgi:hypothetical protein